MSGVSGSPLDQPQYDLFNGNISQMQTAVGHLNPLGKPLATAYSYDQLNRLKQVDAYDKLTPSTNAWQGGSFLSSYHNRFTYDADGNILTQVRRGTTLDTRPLAMDSLSYFYKSTGNNQLDHLEDGVTAGNYSDDLDNQSADNYDYDAIGNLVKDVKEEIADIQWTVYGKGRDPHLGQ